MCLGNPTACKIFAKVFAKVLDVERLEIELHLKHIMPAVFESNEGKDLVEVFLTKADPQNLGPLKKKVFDNLTAYLRDEHFEYFFSKVCELKRADIVDEIIAKIFLAGTFSDQE